MENTTETETVLNDLNRIAAAAKNIKKAQATFRKWKAAHKAGRATEDQVANAKAVLQEAITEEIAAAMEAGLGLGGGDNETWESRAGKVAGEIVR